MGHFFAYITVSIEYLYMLKKYLSMISLVGQCNENLEFICYSYIQLSLSN